VLIDFLFIPDGETHTLGELREINPEKGRRLGGMQKKNLLNGLRS